MLNLGTKTRCDQFVINKKEFNDSDYNCSDDIIFVNKIKFKSDDSDFVKNLKKRYGKKDE